jgi:hypothetical protein
VRAQGQHPEQEHANGDGPRDEQPGVGVGSQAEPNRLWDDTSTSRVRHGVMLSAQLETTERAESPGSRV